MNPVIIRGELVGGENFKQECVDFKVRNGRKSKDTTHLCLGSVHGDGIGTSGV